MRYNSCHLTTGLVPVGAYRRCLFPFSHHPTTLCFSKFAFQGSPRTSNLVLYLLTSLWPGLFWICTQAACLIATKVQYFFFFLECNKPKKQSKIDHLSPHSQYRLFPYWQRSNMVPYWGMYGLMVHINQLELRTVDLTLPILSFLQLPSAGPPG